MQILYIHGYNGSPNGQKVEMIKLAYPKAKVIALQHDSIPAHVFGLLDPIASNLDILEDVIIGNSLGGFWANFFSLRYQLPSLLINPVVSPVTTLHRLGCDFARDYATYEQLIKLDKISPRSVLLAEDDEVIPYHQAFEYFKGLCAVQILKSGGNAMNDNASLDAIICQLDQLTSSVLSWGVCNE
jgi:hypothetical protein